MSIFHDHHIVGFPFGEQGQRGVNVMDLESIIVQRIEAGCLRDDLVADTDQVLITLNAGDVSYRTGQAGRYGSRASQTDNQDTIRSRMDNERCDGCHHIARKLRAGLSVRAHDAGWNPISTL